MKKNLILFAIVLVSMTACRKDRVCECTSTFGVDKTEYKKVTKRWMRNSAECVSRTEYNSDGSSYSVNCEIK